MTLTERQYEILTLIDEATHWAGSERPGTQLRLYFIPRRRETWCSTLRKTVWLEPQTLELTFRAFERKRLIARITKADRFGAAITEQGMIALEEYREKNVYVNGRMPEANPKCPDCGEPLDLDHAGCKGVVRDERNGGWKLR